MNYIKKTILTIFFLFIIPFCFSQQILWSTFEDKDGKYVTLNEVPNEVLEFYDFYDYYYDGTGFSKERFFDFFNDMGFNSESWNDIKTVINAIEEPNVFSFRTNSGRGSEVIVMFVTKENVNVLVFSNTIELDARSTPNYEKDKFKKWLKTLMN